MLLTDISSITKIHSTYLSLHSLFISEFLERRIEYNYDKIGDSPKCISEEINLPNQRVVLQGYGIQPKGEAGELLELELRTITNEECYGEFIAPENQVRFNSGSFGYATVRPALYDGITDELLCTKITCPGDNVCAIGETENCLARFAKCVRI